MRAGKQTYLIEQRSTPARSVTTSATWNPVRGLEITHQVTDTRSGGTTHTEVIHQVPEARVPELVARLGIDIATVPAVIAWASATPDNARRLTSALDTMDPPTLVFQSRTQR